MIQEAAEKKRLEEEERIRQEKRDANGKNFKSTFRVIVNLETHINLETSILTWKQRN